MKPTPIYFFLLLLLAGMPLLYGQEAENTPPLPPSAGSAIHRAVGNDQSFGERMDVIRSEADSVMKETTGKISAVTDSLATLPAHLEAKLREKMDSLQNKLDSLKSKAAGHLARAEEEAGKVTRKIDSLQSLFGDNLQGFQSLGVGDGGMLKVPSLSAIGLPKVDISQLEHEIPGTDLISRIDEQIKNLGGFGRSGRYEQYLGVQARHRLETLKQVQGDNNGIDQIADSRAAQMAELKELGAQTKELEALKGLPEEMLADLKRYQDEQAMKEELKQRAVQKATDYLAGHMDKLSQAQGAMSALKKKYSYVPDSRDLSTATKTSSLKGEPLKRRLVFGLGFQIQRTNPISLDLSPNLLYRFNKLFSAGISGTYRASLGIENNTTVAMIASTDVYGASAIVQHKVWKGFFTHGEFQYLSTPIVNPNPTTDLPSRSWNEGLLLGIGKQMNFSKALKGQIIFTYDFLHNEYSPNPKAWSIKFGFQLGRFRLKDLQI